MKHFIFILASTLLLHSQASGAIHSSPISYNEAATPADVSACLKAWEQRVEQLKTESINTQSPERHRLLESRISKIDGKIADIRMDYFTLRTVEEAKKNKYLTKINDKLGDLTKEYNSIPAE